MNHLWRPAAAAGWHRHHRQPAAAASQAEMQEPVAVVLVGGRIMHARVTHHDRPRWASFN